MILTEDNIHVNALWIGKKLSKLELLTIHSFINKGHIFILWAYDTIETPLPKGVICKDANVILPKDKIFRYKYRNQFGHGKGSLGGFSDIFRYKLLYEQGGWWTDMDITCLKPLNFCEPYVFRTHQILLVVGNLMKCPPKSELMLNCYNKAVEQINEDNTDWHKPIQILCDEIELLNLKNYIKDFTNPDSWQLIRKMVTQTYPILDSWYAIHWVNEEWKRNKVNKEKFLSDSTVYKLFKKYKIPVKYFRGINKLIYSIKQSYFISGLRQSYWYYKRKFIFLR